MTGYEYLNWLQHLATEKNNRKNNGCEVKAITL